MFEDIKKNKVKSGFIVSGFIIMITLIVYYIAMAFDLSGPMAITIAMMFSIITAFASYYNSDKIILSVTKARLLSRRRSKTCTYFRCTYDFFWSSC